MYKSKVLLIIMFSVVVVSFSHAANILYVDVNSPNDPGSGTFEDPFRKIQDAIDDGNYGDIVEIRPGLYTGQRNYDLDPNGKSLTIRSVDPNDSNVVANTIIDPNGAGRGFYFHSGEDANCILWGLSIKNAYSVGSGGALFCNNASPTIMNCIITGNECLSDGGGIGISTSSMPIIRNCLIANNQARYGGGIGIVLESYPVVENCTIAGNAALFNGGGVYCLDSSTGIKNCIIWGNDLSYPPSMGKGLQIGLEINSSLSVSYSDIQGGMSSVSNSASTLNWLLGNIYTDPNFVSFDTTDDPDLWDFHLRSAYGRWDPNSQEWVADSNTSLCIDAGDPNSDWTDEPWPNGKRINMGAYGGTNQASKNGNIADFDVSGTVNLTDLMELASKWLSEQGGIINLDLAGRIDFADFAIFADNWLWQQE